MLKRISVSILGTQLVNCYPFSPVSFWSYWHCLCSVDGRFGSRAGSSQYDFVHAFLEVTGQFMETVLQQGTEASFQKVSKAIWVWLKICWAASAHTRDDSGDPEQTVDTPEQTVDMHTDFGWLMGWLWVLCAALVLMLCRSTLSV